jgi:hypothetical protein
LPSEKQGSQRLTSALEGTRDWADIRTRSARNPVVRFLYKNGLKRQGRSESMGKKDQELTVQQLEQLVDKITCTYDDPEQGSFLQMLCTAKHQAAIL